MDVNSIRTITPDTLVKIILSFFTDEDVLSEAQAKREYGRTKIHKWIHDDKILKFQRIGPATNSKKVIKRRDIVKIIANKQFLED